MRSSRLPQLLRGMSAAALATFTALLGHVSAGGALPGVIGLAVPLVLSCMVGVLLAGRRLSLTRLLLAVSASQFLFHELFVLGSFTPAGGFTVHQHGVPASLPTADVVVADPMAGMWLSHGLTAVVTAIVLHRGELLLSALGRLAARVTSWLVALFVPRAPVIAALPGLRAASRAAEDGGDDTGMRIVRRRPRRGPPMPSCI